MSPEVHQTVVSAIVMDRVSRHGRILVALFVATTFTASALLFIVQPLFAKMALPQLGGSPAVWNTCVLFFQAVLLLAYLHAHLTARWLGPRRQALSQVVLLLLPLLVLPVEVPAGGPPPEQNPTWWLLRMMSAQVGLPFFAVATMAPLVQRWFAVLPLQSAADPYFLYAASNLGSMLALLAFPFVLEPALGVRSQAAWWVVGYLLLTGLATASAVTTWRNGTTPTRPPSESPDAAPVTLRQRAWWILLSFVPSSLMLGVTTHISTDLAAVPLLWIVPLSLYLATFILAFSSVQWFQDGPLARLFPLLALTAIASIVIRISSPYLIGLHLAAFFACAMVCHERLARSRPQAFHLTEFYLWISVGGVIGGAFNTLIAPHLFDGVYEYPIVLALGCLLRPILPSRRRLEPVGLFVVSASVPLLTTGIAWFAGMAPSGVGLPEAIVIAAIVIAMFWGFAQRQGPFNVVIVGVGLLPLLGFGGHPGNVIFSDRSFFGVLKVIDGPEPGRHVLQHGTTLHGRQDLRVTGSCEPLAYFHKRGPIGQVFAEFGSQLQRVGVIGLGTGALACYSEPGQQMTFFEIDPMVGRVARAPELFTYLSNSNGEIGIRIGDGRKLLEDVPPQSFHLIIIDAFSSDSVPVHLLTIEALRLYFSKLRPDGLIAFHISNRYLDLESVIAASVKTEGVFAAANLDVSNPDLAQNSDRSPSHWIVISRTERMVDLMKTRPGWRGLRPHSGIEPWTDDYSNIIDALWLRYQ